MSRAVVRATQWLVALLAEIPRPMNEDSRNGVSWWAVATLVLILTVAAITAVVARIRQR